MTMDCSKEFRNENQYTALRNSLSRFEMNHWTAKHWNIIYIHWKMYWTITTYWYHNKTLITWHAWNPESTITPEFRKWRYDIHLSKLEQHVGNVIVMTSNTSRVPTICSLISQKSSRKRFKAPQLPHTKAAYCIMYILFCFCWDNSICCRFKLKNNSSDKHVPEYLNQNM